MSDNKSLAISDAIKSRALAAQNDGLNTLEGSENYRIMPRMGVIQSLSKQERKDTFGEGSAIITSTESLVIRKDGQFTVVPLFFFTEWCTWSDRTDSESPMILDRSTDRNSDLAKKCMDRNLRTESYGANFIMKHNEHLNFICMIMDGPEEGSYVCISYSKAEFKHGKKWLNKLASMKIEGAHIPIYMTRWIGKIGVRENAKGRWFGLDFTRDSENPFVTDDELEVFENLHLEMKELREKLIVDHEEEPEADEVSSDFA